MATKRIHSHACYVSYVVGVERNHCSQRSWVCDFCEKPEVAMRYDRFTLGAITSEVFFDKTRGKTNTFIFFGLPLNFLKVLSTDYTDYCTAHK